ncbi:sigma-70 family RNA polymerase sigma factor [Lysobacter sp. BMK333-48F3]|uniref:ECF-type sigma factor n=1 Tax=Lysobacter sp. BMK333-48F3 TaxID=2867962 RepID=UPI001C8BF95D|nr:ECF-type sigma factor [Lysobacter sp. BMK333-48F3]MBX9401273.1 sigma-70 family RNA polymerase sigma factor [Lysobacter sp. BMK333-48F3]
MERVAAQSQASTDAVDRAWSPVADTLRTDPAPPAIAHWLQRWNAGDRDALEALLPHIYADLRAMARRELSGHRGHDTLQATALVHDLLLRLLDAEQTPQFSDRRHLFNAAARIMRQLLVDRARRAACDKHGGGWRRDEFVCALDLPMPQDTGLPDLDEALQALERLEPRLAQVVELRCFAGLTVAEVARLLELEERTVYRDWAAARAWLRDRLAD